jgi:(S)-ureidoglycine aminohydrolase
MKKATAIVHAAPRLGARFTQYSAELEKDGVLGDTALQRVIYVLEGELGVLGGDLKAGEYVYIPSGKEHIAVALRSSRVLVIEKPYLELAGTTHSEFFHANVHRIIAQPLMGDSNVRVQSLIPDSPHFDFALNLMTFDPGASLPMVEIHVMEHGLLMLAGGGIYRLGDCWHPVKEGDFIWMAPYCPQWFCAVGKTPAQYLIYKDWNRYAD